jgi:thiol-disulfide isomerase/thioredoxin
MPSASKREAMQRRGRKQRQLWVLVGGVVILVALAAVAISLLGGDEGSTTTPTETAPVTVEGPALPAFTDPENDPAIGTPAPTLVGTSLGGQPMTIDPGSTGKPTAIWFVAHWCPHCQAEVPRIVSLQVAGALPSGIDIYAVSTSVNEAAPNYPPSAWLRTVGWPFPDMADDDEGTAGQAYGLGSFPYLVLTDADGNVVERHAGELGEDGIVQALQQVTS